MKRIIIFASGSGTNAENIIRFFQNNKTAEVHCVLSNNRTAKVFDRCSKLEIKCDFFTKKDLNSSEEFLNFLKSNADLIVLAGFLWKVPKRIIEAFPNKIINIHPALLPKYGGKGMYGMNVHEAVKSNQESETGITIHYVNEQYDKGNIIFQKKVEIEKSDTPKDIATKVHQLEYEHFPKIINQVLNHG